VYSIRALAMPCLDENELALLLEHRLGEAELARVDDHVARCAACRRLVAELGRPGTTAVAFAQTEAAPKDEGALGALTEALARTHADRRIGAMLAGKWTLEKVLGVGGMAQVFGAIHRNGKRVAIKVLRPELCADPSLVTRFLKEGYAANKVEHKGAVSVLDDGVTDDGAAFLVMDRLEGESLAERLAREKRLDVKEVARVADAILDVLAAAHDKGIVHRDIKPENVFVEAQGTVRLLDFGIARVRELSRDRKTSGTEAGAILGTPAYMPPEQARGHWDEVDARSDLWAVGATMYALLTGGPARRANTLQEELLAAMTEPVPSLRRVLPALDPGIARVIDKALSLPRAQRFASAREMKAALRAAMERGPRSRKGGVLGTSVAAIAVLGVAAFAVTRGAPEVDRAPLRAKERAPAAELAQAEELAQAAVPATAAAPAMAAAPATASSATRPAIPRLLPRATPSVAIAPPPSALAPPPPMASATPSTGGAPAFMDKRH
jgi:serine/threonine-protein kinase